MQLVSHNDRAADSSVEATVSRSGPLLTFTYTLAGGLSDITIPPPTAPLRTDNLWRTTCFEAFIGGEGAAYIELNFSPSGAWAAYAFDAYRDGMRGLDLAQAPAIVFDGAQLVASLVLPDSPGAQLGLAAVLELGGGDKSYWALAHPDGPPDFHNRDCFIARLP